MKIALDYDGTYTADPALWTAFVGQALIMYHDIRIVTHRHEKHDKIHNVPFNIPVIYTDGIAKKWYCEHRPCYGDEEGWSPDIWIDDRPQTIFENGPLSLGEIAQWRLNREEDV